MADSVVSRLSCIELFGQEKAKKILDGIFARKRIPHAFLFSGPDGVGKALFARGVAAAINCRQKREEPLFACGRCASCRKIIHRNHPDFQIVAPQNGVMKISQIRQLIKELEYPPYESSMRVVLLEDAHTMGREAANALLKTLEEPQPGNLLILTASSAQKMLETISSRCQKIPFFSLESVDIIQILRQEGLGEDEAALVARLGDGSPGAALELQKTGIVPLWREIIAFLSRPVVSVGEEVFSLLDFAERMAALEEHLFLFLGLFRRWLRDLLFDDRSSLALYCDEFADSAAKCWNKEELFANMNALEDAERALARNCRRISVCETLLFSFCASRNQR